jgi:hypothetical protein
MRGLFLLPTLVAAATGCTFELPARLPNGLPGGCNVYDKLGQLATNTTFNLTDGPPYHVPYLVTGPCGVLEGQDKLCGAPTKDYSGKPTPAVQLFTPSSCLVLGDPSTLVPTPLVGDDGSGLGGVSLVLTGGDAYNCGARGRTVRYDMICDPAAPTTAQPDGLVGATGCDYVITWRTPLACPSTRTSCTAPSPAPTIPTPTAAQARYVVPVFLESECLSCGECGGVSVKG